MPGHELVQAPHIMQVLIETLLASLVDQQGYVPFALACWAALLDKGLLHSRANELMEPVSIPLW